MKIRIPRKKKKRLKKRFNPETYLSFVLENQKKYGFEGFPSPINTNRVDNMGFQIGIKINI